MGSSIALKILVGLPVVLGVSPAAAAVLHVPSQHATIQAAVDAAAPDDTIVVAPGDHCGAVISKSVHIIGFREPTIVGCATGPFLSGAVRIGFLLQGSGGSSPASGSSIAGFRFNGQGVSNTNLAPLAFGILGRFASDVKVVGNRFVGTVQAITNTAGDRWLIAHNRIEDLTVFDCTGLCTGGDGIVVQLARGSLAVAGGSAAPANRPEGNWITSNYVSGSIPDGFDTFGMVGVLVFGADGTTVLGNRLSLPDNRDAEAPGQGILITNTCCGAVTPELPGSRRTVAVFNDASGSEIGINVEGTGGANTEGLVLEHNRGVIVIEGVEQEHKHRRSHFRHRRHLWS